MTGAPWALDVDLDEGEPTFLAHLLMLAAVHGAGPWPGGQPLPDDPPPEEQSFLPSVVADGSRSHHFGLARDPATVAGIADRLAGLTVRPDPVELRQLRDRLGDCPALDLADDLVTELRARDLPSDRLRAVARWLVEHATRRATVKLGLVILGTCGDDTDRDLLLLFGTLDEFTLYAVVALVRTQSTPERREQAVAELARRVSGWGRIHAVERLAGTGDPYEALLPAVVDDALLDGAGGLLAAMATGEGGPAEGLSAYPDAVPALHRYADLVAGAAPSLDRLHAVLTLQSHLQHPPDDLEWPPEAVAGLRTRYDALAGHPRWPDVVAAHLADPLREDFRRGLWPAERLGLHPMPQVLAHLDAFPLDSYPWHWASRHADRTEAAQVVVLAEERIGLDRLADPAVHRLRPGPDRVVAAILEDLVAGLAPHPGTGRRLVAVALASPAMRLRRAAIRTIAAWPGEHVGSDLAEAVAAATARETDPDLLPLRYLPARSGRSCAPRRSHGLDHWSTPPPGLRSRRRRWTGSGVAPSPRCGARAWPGARGDGRPRAWPVAGRRRSGPPVRRR